MKPSDDFKTAIENYLNATAQGDSVLAQSLAKETKNIESCFNYIFGEVKKTGLCAFDNQEIFDIALKYYNDDTIGTPVPINCKVVVNQPVKADLRPLCSCCNTTGRKTRNRSLADRKTRTKNLNPF